MSGDGAPRALVIGVDGQDGSYIAEKLLALGHEVFGVGHRGEPRWVRPQLGFRYLNCDVGDAAHLWEAVSLAQPSTVFHFAAVHGPHGFEYESAWRQVHLVNTVSIHGILEYARQEAPECRIIYASSSKAFGRTLEGVVDERTQRVSTCIYSATKNAGHDLVSYYRDRHGIQASTVILFHHESPRRAPAFFVPRLVESLARSILDPTSRIAVPPLGFWCDWGDANEFMGIVIDLARHSEVFDVVLASGRTWWADQLASELFRAYGLDSGEYLGEENGHHPPRRYDVDISRLRDTLGRCPTRSIIETCSAILRSNYPEAWAERGLHP